MTGVAFPRDACLHQLFEAQTQRTPDATAVIFENQQLTYRELDERANQLAHHLAARGAGPDKLVGLCVERSLDLIIGLLGILKAGAAYVPMDPVFPRERLTYLIEDSLAVLVVTQRKLLARLAAAKCVCLDDVPVNAPTTNPDCGVAADNLAYVIYTSGSTGQPKGVQIEHRQIVNYVAGILQRIEFPAAASFATVSTIAADLGNTMLFPSLCCGGTLHVIAQERTTDAVVLADYFRCHQIDCLKIVPSHLAALLSGPNPQHSLPRHRLILGGEVSRCEWIAGLQKLAPDCVIFNHYGPTETTVGVLAYRVGAQPPATPSGNLPLGRPLLNSTAYILDDQQRPVPAGEIGELYIGGAGVARGYHNRPELTATRFLPDPFRDEPGARMYRTGDRVRCLPAGDIEFLGRVDHQVKIHGYRIEPGEIEAALLAQDGIRQAVVVPRDGRLVAYVVPADHRLPDNLRDRLRAKLPDYMVPAVFVTLPVLPLTPNGKLDRDALPAPVAAQTYRAPRTTLEQTLAGLWQQVLGVERVGLEDNFFDLGGDSLRLIQVQGQISHVLQREVPVTELFQYPTIRALADFLGAPAARPAGRLQRVAARAEQMREAFHENVR
jgi:amino acid adenylation domain-containing protein